MDEFLVNASVGEPTESNCGIREHLSVHLKKRLHGAVSSGDDSCDNTVKPKGKGCKRSKKRKNSEVSKKKFVTNEDEADGKTSKTVSPRTTGGTDCDMKRDPSDSPLVGDVFDGSNSSQESSETLSMSSLLKVVLDRKKKLLLESEELREFLNHHATLNGWVG